MSENLEINVSTTARLMAATRALESQRPNPLFRDPLAEKLAGPEAMQSVRPRFSESEKAGKPMVAVRTRFFDDFLSRHAPEVEQVVLLGSGMDTRAYRMAWWADTHIYEIDQADVLQYKEAVLGEAIAQGSRHPIGADLTESHWPQLLLDKGFQPSQPAIWLLEGFLYYLNAAEVHRLFTAINTLASPGSWLGGDVINTFVANGTGDYAKYWQFGCDHPESFLMDYGWQASAVVQPGEAGACFNRYTFQLADRDVPDAMHIFFCTAHKLD